MTSRWLRRSRGSRDDDQTREARATLTSVFLDMDARQSMTESAVQAASQVMPERRLAEQWQPVRDVCYAAAEAYLAAVDEPAAELDRGGGRPQNSPALENTSRVLDSAARGVDAFWAQHRAQLEWASQNAVGIAASADAAKARARRTLDTVDGIDPVVRTYASVRGSAAELDAAYQRLCSAPASDLVAVRDTTARVTEAVAALEAALAAAPGRVEEARRAVASVRTRIEAVKSRAEAVRPNLSTLLREFAAQSSADLADNEVQLRNHLDQAAGLLAQAVAAQSVPDPEAALAFMSRARAELAVAENRVDGVADRLALLRQLRDEPGAKEKDVRFRLRDAQRLAVGRGQVAEWGTVLDAQVARIDRIVGELGARHPDFWAYHQALDEVSTFIASVVTRIRERSTQ